MKSLMVYIAAVSLVLIFLQSCGTSATPPPPFRAAVEAHIAAVAARDIEALLPTLTQGEELTMIAPNGRKFDTRQQYIDFHTQWFAAPDEGKLEVIEFVRFIESAELGQVFLKYRYSFKDASGATQSMVNWLTLIFALEEGAWRLVFDQNTPVELQQSLSGS
jgi:ketosteroid isomerase-like protein